MATISQALALAVQHHQGGRLQAAEQLYRQILQAEPNHPDALHLLGLIAYQVGKHAIAVEYMERAIRLRPDAADYHGNLGMAYRALRKTPEAIASYRRALELKPDFAEGHSNLGNALKDLGKLDEAVACYRRAIELKPSLAEAHNSLGGTLGELGKLDEAIASCHRALELKPNYAEAHSNLANALKDQRRFDEAVACYRRAVELKPDFAEAYSNLAGALRDQGKLDEAVALYRRAVELKPDFAEAHNNLGNVLKDQGRLDEAAAACRRALELKPAFTEAHSNLLYTFQYRTGTTLAALAEAHAEFDRRHTAPLRGAMTHHARVLTPHDRLRIGFVSADLGRHPIGYYLVGVLENLSPQLHDTICYSDRIVKDDLTHRLQASATQWHDVIGMTDQRLAEQIRADRIDILFDMAGHSARNRLRVFARKPAPIQITWLGYVGTTGLTAMDYILADRYEIPPEAERYYQERVLRMPDGYVCYDPPTDTPPVAPLPALDRGQVTFGCFNNPAKITSQGIEVWAKILRRLTGARLVLKSKGLNDPGTARRFTERFAAHAIDPARLELLGHSPRAELLAAYHRIDVALDPFPYNGCLTTCEALWMGVPVITCPGETFASRHSLSHLSSAGLTQTIAHDLDDYVELAVSLASDLERLAQLRAGLRPLMAASPLCDSNRFAANLASMLHDIWEQRAG